MQLFFSSQRLKFFQNLVANLKSTRAKALLLSPAFFVTTLIIALLPALLLVYFLYHRYDILAKAEQRVHLLELKAKKTMLVRAKVAAFMKQLQTADKNVIPTHLASLRPLAHELKMLKFLRSTEALQESQSLKAREDALKENTFTLCELTQESQHNIQESVYALVQPVEIDFQDLKRLLEGLEQPGRNKPQALVQSMTLTRKNLSSSYEVFECDFKLLQRTLQES